MSAVLEVRREDSLRAAEGDDVTDEMETVDIAADRGVGGVGWEPQVVPGPFE